MKQTLFGLILTTLILTACSTSPSQEKTAVANIEEQALPGDSTRYGLACAGCTDSVLLVLPYNCSDPDTIDILQARINHQVLGRPEIGDQLAIVLNGNNKKVADKVINLDRLKGEWCYLVTPQLRQPAGVAEGRKGQLPPDLPDSIRWKWLEPREYGIDIRRDYTSYPIGIQRTTTDEQSPVVYPPLKRYRQWHIYNGQLILTETSRDTTGTQHIVSTDTADIILLRPDSLVLRFQDKVQGYYRQKKG